MKHVFTVFTVLCVLLCLCAFGGIGWMMWHERYNPCVCTEPHADVRGHIERVSGGFFAADRQRYILTYAGTHERSGESCRYRIVVTEGEYERRMYDHSVKGDGR